MSPASNYRLRILIIEDEVIIGMLLEDMLTDLGHVIVATASTLKNALVIAAEGEFDLAFLDVNLGRERTGEVARLMEARQLPFVISTGYSDDAAADFAGHPRLIKPLTEAQVKAAIDLALPETVAEIQAA